MPTDETTVYRRRLPHWRTNDAVYFITWRLASNQPILSEAERDLVVAALRNFDGQRYQLFGYVVMDDHIHVVAKPAEGHELTAILQAWKSYTANRLQRAHGRNGRVWQRESFDRVIRDDAD